MNQKQMQAATIHMQLFLTGLSFAFDSSFFELEEITKRALLQIEAKQK
jgi:hypothetical protein